MFKNTLDNKRYYTLNYYYKKKYNSKVFKVSLNGGFTCPNKDGTVGTRGCIFCSRLGSGDFAGNKNLDLISQFNEVKSIMLKKWPDAKYIGYFQANTNTYAPLDQLKAKYETILNLDNVVGLNIATRSDSITDEVMDYLEELNNNKNVDEVHLQKNTLKVTYKKGKNNLVELMDLLKKYKIKYSSIYSEKPTLNDVFLSLTGKELRD